ncbi:ABC transporter permease subunit [Mesobacillus boroniphilus]|uniref:ABC transporter permease subunit n=1 Tax=Mesobacillus boroniphilus TaxID=308892 RepID=A0A944CR35_9BACI|nr:ABC transporter permease subunit [Mesobacillus boroniphilus]MBS8266253.1 ABC transporter permease subunit [Mesobacillus boroniphilus]
MNKSLLFGLIILSILVVIAFVAPYLPFVDTSLKETVMRQKEDGGFELPPFAPSADYPIGSDANGKDLLSRVLLGTKETLLTILAIVLIRYIIAIPLAMASFYSRFLQRILIVWNRLFSFMPPIFFVILLIGTPFITFSSNRYLWIMLVLALIEAGRVADVFFQGMVNISKKPYVEAGIVAGSSPVSMLKNYYWPPLRPFFIVQFFSDLGRTLFLIGQLGIVDIFLSVEFVSQLSGGYKAMNTSNVWPTYFAEITHHIWSHPWLPITGTIAIGITILAFSMTSSGLQRYYDKKYKRA